MVFAAPDTTSSGAAYALCHPQKSPSPSPSPSQSQSEISNFKSEINLQSSICNLQSDISPSESSDSALPALPSTADIDALASLEDLNRPAQIIHYLESRLHDWAAADTASARPPDLAKLNSFTLLFSRVNTARKNTLARREALLAAQKSASPSETQHSDNLQSTICNLQSDIPNPQSSICNLQSEDDAASFIPDPVNPAPDWTGLRSLRAWLREMFVSGHFGELDRILRLCCFEAWEDLQRNNPEKARKIMTCWPYPDGREPPWALLQHWFNLHSPDCNSERRTLLRGINNEGYGVSWFADGRTFVAYNREPDPFRINSSAGVSPAATPAPANTQTPSPNPDPLYSEVSTSDTIPAEVESDLTPNEAPSPNPSQPKPQLNEPSPPWPPPRHPSLRHLWRSRARPDP